MLSHCSVLHGNQSQNLNTAVIHWIFLSLSRPISMIHVWMLTLHMLCFFSRTSAEILSVTLHKCWKQPQREFEWQRWRWNGAASDSPYPFHRAGSRGRLKMASPRESQQLAITLAVCLHQSTHVCWPSNMMSLLISCIPLMGSRGASYPHSRHFLPCCIMGYVLFLWGDQLDFFKVLHLLVLFFSLFLFNLSFAPVCRFPPHGAICFALS